MANHNSATVRHVGKRIRDTRKGKGLNLHDVARLMGISVPAVSKLETGTTDINLSRLQQIADILEIDICFLLAGTENAKLVNQRIQTEAAEKRLALYDEEIVLLQRKVITLYEELLMK
ncbi:helix-turn-helix domain-containing protein [Mucilaginibacter pedocola]|uniref:HTH cro/C1-type domain-containing protein n=1 Tax=Mucilaginibacter pedocola TaxID=1792845 RepID=A0A1S9PHI3_9SPHI|nr:helix-turn-helix transcriptional regulator [Mucilaginibacter pedocola]OOQ60403.1 hypothetical protein BC343_25650 [Mucilaginibacter pedocola]